MQRHSSPMRQGFTVIELLVTIAIVAILLSITIPAVMRTRATAQRLQCVNNLKQIVLAIHNYVDLHGVLPPGTTDPNCPSACFDDMTVAYPLGGNSGGITLVFPQMELPSYCEAVCQNIRRIEVLICPADGRASQYKAPLSYVVNASPGDSSGYPQRGPFDHETVLKRLNRPRDVLDGLSQTVGVSERAGLNPDGTEQAASLAPERYFWSVNVPGLSPPVTPAARRLQTEESISKCLHGPRTFISASVGFEDWRIPTNARYTHWFGPNSPNCTGVGYGNDVVFIDTGYAKGPSSAHTGGVNVAFLDGHVHFVANSIDRDVWRALGTQDGGEVVSY